MYNKLYNNKQNNIRKYIQIFANSFIFKKKLIIIGKA